MDDDITDRRIHKNIGEMCLIKSRNDVVATLLWLYNDIKAAFVAAMGEEAYNNNIIELLSKLPDPSAPSIGGRVAHDEGDESSNDS